MGDESLPATGLDWRSRRASLEMAGEATVERAIEAGRTKMEIEKEVRTKEIQNTTDEA